MKRSVIMLGLLLVIGLASGCFRDLGDVLNEKEAGGGTSQTYPVGTEQAWKIARTVFRWSGADAIEEHRDEGYMLTSHSGNWLTAGTVMGAWIAPAGRGQSQVTVVTKRRMATNIATGLTEDTFHERFARAVQIVQAGNPLPADLPKGR